MSVCLYSGFIQHAERMRRIILSSVAYVALQYFFKHSHKRHNFRKKKKKVIQRETCVMNFSTAFVCSIYYFKKRSGG
jgi:hypothetical protein